MRDLLLVLILWINQHTSLQYDDLHDLPHVARVTQETLAASVLRTSFGRLLPWRERQALARQAGALYVAPAHVIRVAEDVNLDSPWGRALLVRELAFMIQLEQGGGRGCDNVMARNALRVQQQYIASTLHVSLTLGAEDLLRLSPCRL